ncbi:MAG: B12-binding domain-containing radical SAM protein [Bacteroidetes bacterium]|nr:B12-binding domain-containing radical SAM protein [Bacteroidota bacterium]
MKPSVLFITPPFTQLNTPYPATAFLKGFLNTKKTCSNQADLGIEVILRVFSREGLTLVFDEIRREQPTLSRNGERMIALEQDYLKTIDEVIVFLQSKNPTLSHRICRRDYLPEASRFDLPYDPDRAFGTHGNSDKAKHLATLYLSDLSDLITEAVDPLFGFSRYAEKLGRYAYTFDELEAQLNKADSLIDKLLTEQLEASIQRFQPSLIALSVPFPGNLYSALKCGQWIKAQHPDLKILTGGGFINTELRSLSDPGIFRYVDYICLDDGEIPLLNLMEHLEGKRSVEALKRTFTLQDHKVCYFDGSTDSDCPVAETGTPDYADLPLDSYLPVIEITNPMHSLWTDGRWNKLMLAHGCYWGQCTFCDTSLDYIKRYEPGRAADLCDKMEAIISQTGQNGFHFVDEAAPPVLLRDLALEIIRRGLTVTWWTNIRFEKTFTHDLCRLLKESGCIAVSGGLEVASDRLLQLINKGVTVSQAAQVASHFASGGIMVHTYLMYGFPTQTKQETIDSLEVVRQLFFHGIVQSGFWHLFTMTAHSPIGLDPQRFKVERRSLEAPVFAVNDLVHTDKTGADHVTFSDGLKKALYNYMHGICFEFPLQKWFDFPVPRPSIPPDFIEKAIVVPDQSPMAQGKRLLWTGNLPSIRSFNKNKKGNTLPMAELKFHNKSNTFTLELPADQGEWLYGIFPRLSVHQPTLLTVTEFEQGFLQQKLGNFDVFWTSRAVNKLRNKGLLIV